MLGAYIPVRSFLRPECVGAAGRRQGYVQGFKDAMLLYELIILILAISAVYEFFEIVVLLPMLR
jgi:hypothetical protein